MISVVNSHYYQVKFTTQVVNLSSEFTIITTASSESEAQYTATTDR